MILRHRFITDEQQAEAKRKANDDIMQLRLRGRRARMQFSSDCFGQFYYAEQF